MTMKSDVTIAAESWTATTFGCPIERGRTRLPLEAVGAVVAAVTSAGRAASPRLLDRARSSTAAVHDRHPASAEPRRRVGSARSTARRCPTPCPPRRLRPRPRVVPATGREAILRANSHRRSAVGLRRDQTWRRTRFADAITAIDAANADDPNIITARGRTGPKEVLHAELVTEWVELLRPDASEALLLAARGHHLRRWTMPRASYPAGRAAYLRWRRDLHEQHARELGEILETRGLRRGRRSSGCRRSCASATSRTTPRCRRSRTRCASSSSRHSSPTSPAKLDPDKLASVLEKTARKMSAHGRAAIARVPLDDEGSGDPGAARSARVPSCTATSTGLAAHAWPDVAACLAPDVERIGPYRDIVRGRDAYAEFLAHHDRCALGLRAPGRTRGRRRARPSSPS